MFYKFFYSNSIKIQRELSGHSERVWERETNSAQQLIYSVIYWFHHAHVHLNKWTRPLTFGRRIFFWRFLSSLTQWPGRKTWLCMKIDLMRLEHRKYFELSDWPLVLPCDDWWRDFELVYISWNNKNVRLPLNPPNKWNEKNTTQSHTLTTWLTPFKLHKPIIRSGAMTQLGRLLFVDLTGADGCRVL